MAGDDLSVFLFFLSLAVIFGVEAVRAELDLAAHCVCDYWDRLRNHGIFWLHIKQIWPPLTAATALVATSPLAWFVVVMFILAVFRDRQPNNLAAAATRRSIAEVPRTPLPKTVEAPPRRL